MKHNSVLAHQTVQREKRRELLGFKRVLGQLGFVLIKMVLFLLFLGALSVGLISGYQFLSSARWFKIQDIEVIGAGDSMKKALIKLSGITEGDSLLSIDIATVERTIEKHPWIKDVTAARSFPHRVRIEVQHEEPIAVVVLDRMCLMNKEGILFKDIEKNDPIDFPIITGLSGNTGELGGHLTRVSSFLSAYSLWSEVLLARDLSEVHVEKDGALSVYFNDLPFKIAFGRDDFDRKIISLQRIIKHLKTTHQLRKATLIDMDYQDRGVVAFREQVI
jgi:cell division protein FtsQ